MTEAEVKASNRLSRFLAESLRSTKLEVVEGEDDGEEQRKGEAGGAVAEVTIAEEDEAEQERL